MMSHRNTIQGFITPHYITLHVIGILPPPDPQKQRFLQSISLMFPIIDLVSSMFVDLYLTWSFLMVFSKVVVEEDHQKTPFDHIYVR